MRTTPPHLQPALSRIKRYVEKMPEGVTLTQLNQKVQAYHQLSKADKGTLLAVISESGVMRVVGEGRSTVLHHPKFGHRAVTPLIHSTKSIMEPPVIKKTVAPEEMRRQAEELLRAAEEAEKKASDRAEIKKQLDATKLEVLQAFGQASRKFDEFVDAMAEMGNAVQKLKKLTM